MRIKITDMNEHEVFFDVPQMRNWSTEGLILALEEFTDFLKSKTVDDSDLF